VEGEDRTLESTFARDLQDIDQAPLLPTTLSRDKEKVRESGWKGAWCLESLGVKVDVSSSPHMPLVLGLYLLLLVPRGREYQQ